MLVYGVSKNHRHCGNIEHSHLVRPGGQTARATTTDNSVYVQTICLTPSLVIAQVSLTACIFLAYFQPMASF